MHDPATQPPATVRLTPGKRVLFLTKDADRIRRQIDGSLDLGFAEVDASQLLDDVNTDTMTPAWVCFQHRPEDIAREAYAGLVVAGERVIPRDGLAGGGFEVIVSGARKGVGSSRETAVHAEKWSGIRIAVAASFAPIHARNNINQGVLMCGYDVLRRLMAGEGVALEAFLEGHDPVTQLIIRGGGLFPFAKALARGDLALPRHDTPARPMTMTEKVLARHRIGDGTAFVAPGDPILVEVDGGYSHDFTSAQVHTFLEAAYGAGYEIVHPERFAVFEDHLVYADDVPRYQPHLANLAEMRRLQRSFQRHTGVAGYLADNGTSPGICHEVARERLVSPGDFIQATDSHTCMGGANNALAWGVGVTEYANLISSGFTFVRVPPAIRFELVGELAETVTAKDVMLHILLHYARRQLTLDRVLEFTGPGLASLSMDERATLANMATECSARGAIIAADDATFVWLAEQRPEADVAAMRARAIAPDPHACYEGGVHTIDLAAMRPMVAHPGDPDRGIPSDPTNGALVTEIGEVAIDIAYGGSCTAGKVDDLRFYHQVVKEALDSGRRLAPGVTFLIQFGSQRVEQQARDEGFVNDFERAGVRLLRPGCGACIGCGPGTSEREEQVTVSAINRNYRGRSGPGKLYLASPLTVAASAFEGKITAYRPGMFRSP